MLVATSAARVGILNTFSSPKYDASNDPLLATNKPIFKVNYTHMDCMTCQETMSATEQHLTTILLNLAISDWPGSVPVLVQFQRLDTSVFSREMAHVHNSLTRHFTAIISILFIYLFCCCFHSCNYSLLNDKRMAEVYATVQWYVK